MHIIHKYSYSSLKVPFLGEMTFSAVFSFQLCQLSSQRDPIHSSSAARCTSIYGNFMKFHGVVSIVQKHPETNINKVVPYIQLYHLAPKKWGWKLEDDRSCHVQCSSLLGSCHELYHASITIFLGDLHVYKYIQIIWHGQIVTSHVVRILALLFPRTSFRNFPLVMFGRQMSSSLSGGRGEHVLLVETSQSRDSMYLAWCYSLENFQISATFTIGWWLFPPI